MKQSIALLSVHKMELSKEKSSKEPLPITHSFEFLGIELSNGFIRPASKAQSKHLNSLRVVFEESAKAFREYRSGAKFQRTNSLVATLRRVDGMSQGWAKHYRFCNDKTIFEGIDKKISEMIGSFIGVYSNTIKRVGEDGRRTLLGVGRLTEVEFKPFIWPKLT
jgi:hypothetical protein